jgi:hypothetical protein
MRRSYAFSSLSTVLEGLAKRLGLDSKLLEFRLRREWPQIVGAQIGAHTRPDQIKFKKLFLLVENSVWLQQLTFLKPTLLEKINAAAGEELVTDIALRVGDFSGEHPGAADDEKERSQMIAAPPPDAEALAQAAAHAEVVQDPELRDRLTSMIAAALSVQPDTKPTERERSGL